MTPDVPQASQDLGPHRPLVLASETLDQVEIGRSRDLARLHQRLGIVNQGLSLDGLQLVEMFEDVGCHLVAVAGR